MTTTIKGLSDNLRGILADSLGEDNWVMVYHVEDDLRDEMIEAFGGPIARSYMSEESGWRLDEEDAEAVRALRD